MNRIVPVALSTMAALSLAACTAPPEAVTTGPPSPQAPETLRFGQAHTYDDGLTVQMSRPKPYTPTPTAVTSGDDTPRYVRFTVTVDNRMEHKYDPKLIHITASSGEAEAPQVFDTDNGLAGAPQTPVLTDSKVSYDVAFGVTSTTDVTAQITPDIQHDGIVFTLPEKTA